MSGRRLESAIAANNVSFGVRGSHRTVLVRNALHFVHDCEAAELARMPRGFTAQIPVVRQMLRRADVVVAPTTSMAERIASHVPSVSARIVVRGHPVTAPGPRRPADSGFILVPIVPGPYKNLVPQLKLLVDCMAREGSHLRVHVTAAATDLPDDLAYDPMVRLLGRVSTARMEELWCTATAAFFPCTLESFGYPLAESRVLGLPVIAPDTSLSREVAGPALRSYRTNSPDSLSEALESLATPIQPDPGAFDSGSYFRWLTRI
jgi:hypothetical protein